MAKVVGAVVGGIFGLLVMVFGFLRTLTFAFFIGLGFATGRYLDNHRETRDAIVRFLWPPRE
jgi:uncharacterized membrane protein